MAVQLFGSEAEFMAEAAKRLMVYKPDIIDINMGCPVPKVAGNGAGSALMKDPKLAAEIVEATVKAVPVPVTVKFRKGWDENSVNAVETKIESAENLIYSISQNKSLDSFFSAEQPTFEEILKNNVEDGYILVSYYALQGLVWKDKKPNMKHGHWCIIYDYKDSKIYGNQSNQKGETSCN